MSLSTVDLALICSAVLAIMMLGTTNIRSNLSLYALHTFLIVTVTLNKGWSQSDFGLLAVGAIVLLVKVWFVPRFLSFVTEKVGVLIDSGAFIPTPVAMHLGIALLGASYLLSQQLVLMGESLAGIIGATAALSIISTGMLLMLTRNIAVNQVVGFLVIENGIYVFSLTQTHGMPMIIEMGVLLDVLVGVMIAGLLLFRIKTNFEHIDVSKLNELKD